MPMRISKSTQDKLEDLFKAADYQVRYEKGNFQGGYCIVKEHRIILINKFHPLESKINTLIELVRQLDFSPEELDPEQQKLVEDIKRKS